MAPEADVVSLWVRAMWHLVCPLQGTCGSGAVHNMGDTHMLVWF